MFRTYEEIYEALPPVLRTKDIASALGISEDFARILFKVDWGLETITNTAFRPDRRQFLFCPLVELFKSLFDRLCPYKGVSVRIGFYLRPVDEQGFKVYLAHLRKLFDQLTEQVFSAP